MPSLPELAASILTKWGDTVPGPTHPKHRVAVVGAGVSGLIAARVLQIHGHDVTLFEREESPKARFQGGSLDIHPKSGQVALELAGVTKEFWVLARPEGQVMRIVDKNTITHYVETSLPGESNGTRPEVDRGQLRQILLDALEPDTIQWGSAVKSAEATEDGSKVRLLFKDDIIAERHGCKLFDAIIGADGAWSRIRPVLSPTKPEYTGIVSIELSINDIDNRHPEIASLVGQGLFSALDDKKVLTAQRNSGGNIRVYSWLHVPLTWPEDTGIASMSPAEVSAYLRTTVYSDWSPRLLALLDAAAVEAREPYPIRPLFQLPSPHSWKTFPGGRIAVVGDAAHVSFPTGEGANLAMLDGAEAALAIASARDSAMLELKMAEFEKEMMERGAASATEGTMMKDSIFFNERGPAGVAEFLRQLSEARGEPLVDSPQEDLN